jgi:hypothetical protein
MAKRKSTRKTPRKNGKAKQPSAQELAEAMHGELQATMGVVTTNAYDQGRLLSAINDADLWRELKFASFQDYVDNLGMSAHTVNRRVQIWKAFSGRTFDMDKLASVGIERAYYISFGIDGRTNVNRLLDKVARQPLELVEQESRKHRGLPRRTVTYRPMFQAKLRYPKHLADIEAVIADIVDGGHANTRGDAIHFLAKGYLDAIRR